MSCDRQAFESIDLGAVEPTARLPGPKGQLLDRPDTGRAAVGVRAAMAGGAAHNSSGPGSEGEPSLLEMDPVEFEQLVGRLLTCMGWNVRTTQRSGDGGVDLVADDPDPFTVGTVLVQVKRYHSTVSPDVVRDMFGTLHHVGAGRGLVVTTSSFGPGAYELVRNKPINLIEGDQLVHLLGQHELPGRIDW